MTFSTMLLESFNHLDCSELFRNEVLRRIDRSNENAGARLLVLGRNVESTSVIKAYTVNAVIDDNAAKDTMYHEVPVISMKDVKWGDVVVNCSSTIAPLTAHYAARQRTPFVLSYSLLASLQSRLCPQSFVKEQRDDLRSFPRDYDFIYDRFLDHKSKEVFSQVLQYRLSGDYEKNRAFRIDPFSQYFEDFLHLKSEVFLDVGGFDGDTALMHAIVDPEYEKIVVLEPSALNRSIAVERLNSLARVEVLPFGVGRFNGVLPFCDELGVASCVSKEGDSTIQVRRIDDLGLRKLTFLKMDIEGAELDALVGAERLIVKHKPKIAIAAYHKPDDFREISRIVLHMNPGYKMSLRHYTEGWSESVLYFY